MHYIPESPPNDGKINEWLFRELNRIAAVILTATVREVEFLNVAPVKPREGMIRGADGTNWNPGAGKGVYAYYGGVWNKL